MTLTIVLAVRRRCCWRSRRSLCAIGRRDGVVALIYGASMAASATSLALPLSRTSRCGAA